ncbi:MAG TPA: hypothetical protein VJ455_07370 [Ignavibacteria bacterium]|nr:hypothetical protein [Ignavibacteria bacterium]
MDIIIDHSRIPHKEWKWNDNEIGFDGVNTKDGCLKWFTFRNAHGGNTITVEQSYEDFLKDGPLKESIPADVIVDLYDEIMNAVESDGGTMY